MMPSQQLGPEPIPYPNQLQSSTTSSTPGTSSSNASSDLTKSQQQQIQTNSSSDSSSTSASYLSMRPPVASATTPQKKDLGNANASGSSNLSTSSGAAGLSNTSNPLGSLVGGGGSVSSHYSSYSLPKTSTTFPSPPSGPYSQPHVQVNFHPHYYYFYYFWMCLCIVFSSVFKATTYLLLQLLPPMVCFFLFWHALFFYNFIFSFCFQMHPAFHSWKKVGENKWYC